MIKYIKYTALGILILSLGILLSCGSQIKQDGGDSEVTYTETTTTIDDVGNPVIVTKSITSDVQQPESPASPGSMSLLIDPNGGFRIQTSTGSSRDDTKTLANIQLLEYVVYAGIGLIIIGVLIAGLLLKNWVWAGIIAGTGVGMIVLTYLLAQYAIYFLFGCGILCIYGGYILFDLWRNRKVVKETVATVQEGKKRGIINPDEFANVANSIQSDVTINTIRKIKKKI